jgi:hypothetical protein
VRRKRARDNDGGGARGSGALLPGDERVLNDAQVEAAMASMFEDESDDPDVELDSEEEEELVSMPAGGGLGINIKDMLATLAEQLKRGMMDGLEPSANENLHEMRAPLPPLPFVPPPGRHHAVMYVPKADTDKRCGWRPRKKA